jgi:uncharacterized protein (TIGR02996 family)
MHEGERDWVRRVVENLSDDQLKLDYADWLAERGDKRAQFLRQFVAAAKSMNAGDFPSEDQQPREWLELIGYRLLSSVARYGAVELKKPLLRLARPALRMKTIKKDDSLAADGSAGGPGGGTAGRPFGLLVHGRYDTTGAVRSVLSIVGALGWRQSAEVLEVMGDVDDDARAKGYELGATLAALLAVG